MTVNIKCKAFTSIEVREVANSSREKLEKGQRWLQLDKNIQTSGKFCEATDDANLIIKPG